jgi:hypothetical protein
MVKGASALAVAGLLLAAAVVAMDMSGGPFQGVVGVVRAVGLADGDGGSGATSATVVLSDGQVIRAAVVHSDDARVGETVHVRVYHRFISGGTRYEVMHGMKEAATK